MAVFQQALQFMRVTIRMAVRYMWGGEIAISRLLMDSCEANYHFRAFHEGDQIPAKVIPGKQACYVPHNGLEVFKPNFELLSGSGFQWIGSSNGHVPAGGECKLSFLTASQLNS